MSPRRSLTTQEPGAPPPGQKEVSQLKHTAHWPFLCLFLLLGHLSIHLPDVVSVQLMLGTVNVIPVLPASGQGAIRPLPGRPGWAILGGHGNSGLGRLCPRDAQAGSGCVCPPLRTGGAAPGTRIEMTVLPPSRTGRKGVSSSRPRMPLLWA